jgi:hypothetical protein
MTPAQATAKGYKVVPASAIEVGLLKNDKGVCTWWARDFDGKLPGLDHPLIQKAIEICERNKHLWPDLTRAQRWQLRQVVAGRCKQCGKVNPDAAKRMLCPECDRKQRIAGATAILRRYAPERLRLKWRKKPTP